MSIRHKFWFMGMDINLVRLFLKSSGLFQVVGIVCNVQ